MKKMKGYKSMKKLKECNELGEKHHILRQMMIYLKSPDISYPFTFGDPNDKAYQGFLRHMEKNPYKPIKIWHIIHRVVSTKEGWNMFWSSVAKGYKENHPTFYRWYCGLRK